MIILLSPAKKLTIPAPKPNQILSEPALIADAISLSEITRKLTTREIRQMMKLSDNLAELTFERFQALDLRNPLLGSPAVLTFAGDVYRGLNAASLSEKDLAFAQEHLRILSGLYGVLRPLDVMQPYRLEMGRKLTTDRGEDLYDFWGSRISKELNNCGSAADPVVINLASNEYFKSVDKTALKAKIINPVFKEEKDGQQRILSMFAKVARGLMARWIIQNRITDAAQLKSFNIAGYCFQVEGSTDDKPLFVRPQPAKKQA